MKKILGRIIIVIPAIALQGLWYSIMLGLLNGIFHKLLWVMVIVAMPILGAMLYFFLGNKNTGKKLKRKLAQSASMLPKLYREEHTDNISDIKKENFRIGQTLKHVSEATGFPVLKNDTSKYYSFGEEMFKDMCEDLRKAVCRIFYYSIREVLGYHEKYNGRKSCRRCRCQSYV